MRHITQHGLNLIRQFEGFSSLIYLDAAGLPTIGYGHLLRAGEAEMFKNGITESVAQALLIKDVLRAEQAVLRLITVPLTGIVALLAVQSEAFLGAMYVMEGSAITGMKPLAWVIMLAPLGLAIALGVGINRMSLGAAQASFWGFAVVMGLSLSTIFLTYTGTSVARVFFITAGTFGAMSIYGYTTRRDLTQLGSFLIMGVIGLIIASLVNIFLQSSALQFALSVIGVLAFTGLTAYDTQRLKGLYYEMSQQGEAMAKTVIMGALTLYLDFINIFMSLMHLLGDRKQ